MKYKIATFEGLKSLPTSVAILDASGTIVAVNDRWKQFGRRSGLRVPHSAIGSNYLQYCQSDEPNSLRFVGELRALLAGERDLLTFIYPCHSRTQARWFCLIGLPLSENKSTGVALLHVNLTAMLPLPIDMPRTRVTDVNGQMRPGVNLAAIGGALERSLQETLSSQLNTMFTGPASRKKSAAQREADQINAADVQLSKRQTQVLHLLGEGKTNKEIATTLFLSPNTVKLHVSAILERLNLRSRTQAALLSSTLFQDRNTEVKARAAPGK
ncbi:response regulator transcription factor [Bradyrhizobium cenepequi]